MREDDREVVRNRGREESRNRGRDKDRSRGMEEAGGHKTAVRSRSRRRKN